MVQNIAKKDELQESVLQYLASGSKKDKETVIHTAEALVNYFAGLYSPERLDEDLQQVAYEGILKALKRYDPTRNVMFSTYATHCIIGEIRHELRRRGPLRAPEWIKNLQARIIDATEELAQVNGTMPTLSDIARRINVREEGIAEAMLAGCVSLDEVDFSKVKHIRYESFKLPIEDKITVQMSLDRVDELSRKVLTLIFYEGLTQEEVARRLGINQRKVSRIMNSGLREMRVYLV